MFQHKQINWRIILQHARKDANEWSEHCSTQSDHMAHGNARVRSTHQNQHWQMPYIGWVKCNVYGSFVNNELPSKAGWIIRDENGVYQGACQGNGGKVSNPLESEFQEIIMAMQHCFGRGYKRVIIEGDCQKAIDLLNRRDLHFHAYNWIREALWWKQ
ncbi:unnamed protein product [Brassica rapa]|uniref:RNase H type-1 domain-containing protein n=1 Tax=Brassica campestris TaxID=3711 RepID=A0A3P5Y111_BRACM|nr:unnamed protein product [Brassica rapa]VDC60826.1 unnamed protein product [Brassica rapa]